VFGFASSRGKVLATVATRLGFGIATRFVKGCKHNQGCRCKRIHDLPITPVHSHRHNRVKEDSHTTQNPGPRRTAHTLSFDCQVRAFSLRSLIRASSNSDIFSKYFGNVTGKLIGRC